MVILACLLGPFKTGNSGTSSIMWFGLVPYDSYTTAVGVSCISGGIASIFASPFAAIFYSISGEYVISLSIATSFALFSGIFYAIVCFLTAQITR